MPLGNYTAERLQNDQITHCWTQRQGGHGHPVLSLLMLVGFANVAAAQGTSIVFSVFFCPAGSTVSTVIDGEPTQEGPFVADALDSVTEAVVTVPDGVPGDVLAVICGGTGVVAIGISASPPGTFCPNPANSNVTNYVPPPGQLCLKINSVGDAQVGDVVGGDVSRLLANGADPNRFADLFQASAVRTGVAPAELPGQSVGLNTSTSLAGRLVLAAVAAGGLGAFALRRRKFAATT